MKHHSLTISRQLDIAFNRKSTRDGGSKGTFAIFHRANLLIVQPAVRNGPVHQPVEGSQLRREPHQAISTTASTSTDTPIGNEDAPTAERACLPASPKT